MASHPTQCHTCGRYFGSSNELQHHSIEHLPETVPCHGCSRRFRRYADMLIHLEAGNCASRINLVEINRSAAMCFQWKKYMFKEFREDLLKGKDDYRMEADGLPFKCPRCGDAFPLLSSLFMHIWSPGCSQGFNGVVVKKLRRWLGKRLYRKGLR